MNYISFQSKIYFLHAWLKLVAPDVIDVAAGALVRSRPEGEALVELVGLLVDQLKSFAVFPKIFFIRPQSQTRLVNISPSLKSNAIH